MNGCHNLQGREATWVWVHKASIGTWVGTEGEGHSQLQCIGVDWKKRTNKTWRISLTSVPWISRQVSSASKTYRVTAFSPSHVTPLYCPPVVWPQYTVPYHVTPSMLSPCMLRLQYTVPLLCDPCIPSPCYVTLCQASSPHYAGVQHGSKCTVVSPRVWPSFLPCWRGHIRGVVSCQGDTYY